MKKTISLILLFFLLLSSLAACSTSKADVIQDMVAPKGSYNIYVFWDGENTDYQELVAEMLNVINSEAILKSMNINNMTFISVNDKTQKYNYKRSLIFNIPRQSFYWTMKRLSCKPMILKISMNFRIHYR